MKRGWDIGIRISSTPFEPPQAALVAMMGAVIARDSIPWTEEELGNIVNTLNTDSCSINQFTARMPCPHDANSFDRIADALVKLSLPRQLYIIGLTSRPALKIFDGSVQTLTTKLPAGRA